MKSWRTNLDFEKMVMHSPDIMGSIDRPGYILFVNDACKNILGYEKEEVIGCHYTDFLRPEDHFSSRQAIEEVIKNKAKTVTESRHLHKQGHSITIHWSVSWSEGNDTIYCIGRDVTEIKAKELLLEESEKKYRALFDYSPDLVFVEGKEGLINKINQRLKEKLNKSNAQVIGAPASSFLSAEMAAVNEKYLKQALLGNFVRFNLEVEINGENRTYDTTKHPILVKEQVVSVQTVARDITPIVRSNETIKRQANKLNTVFESITDGFFTLDKDWNFTYINSEAARLLHINNDFIGKNAWKEFPEEINGTFYHYYNLAIETGKSVSFKAYYGGSDRWLEVKAFPSKEGISSYFSDITESVKSRQEIEKLSLVASKTNNSVLIADSDYRIEWVNEGFTRLMGYSLEEAVGKRPSELLHSPKTNRTTFLSLENKLLQGESITFEVRNRKKDGTEVWLSVDDSPIFDQYGKLSGFIEVQTDITAIKTSELALTQSAQDLYRHNRDLQQFTYIVSHNLRAPVANALGLTDLLTKIPKDSELFKLSLSNLKQSVIQLDTVLRDMNTILSIRDSKLNLEQEPVAIKSVIQQALHFFQEPLQKCGGQVFEAFSKELAVKTNRAYLYSIFFNLLSNAIKYRSSERLLQVQIKCFNQGGKGMLIVFSDNGSGFDMKKAEGSIFNLYKRFHPDKKGRGIGLYLIKTHLEAMGGHIEVNSREGAGTRFLIYLPNS